MSAPQAERAHMSNCDWNGVVRDGVRARKAGLSYFNNPHHFTTAPVETDEQWSDWIALCSAWSAGWLNEDAGRDLELRALARVKYW